MAKTVSPVVMVLEDEYLIAIDLEARLQAAGFDVVLFANRSRAERWLQTHSPDIAILDVILSDGTCVGAATVLVKRGIPFIVHSGDAEFDPHRDSVFQAGTWIGKPDGKNKLIVSARQMAGLSV